MKLSALQERADLLNQSIIRLSREDYNTLLIVTKIRKAIRHQTGKAEIAAFIKNEFDYQLDSHFAEEETLLFSKLPHNNDLRIEAQRHHDQLKYFAWVCSNEQIPDTLPEQFANLLEEHIRFEERTLFPYIQSVLKVKKVKSKPVNSSSRLPYQIL